jgi:hypothetical protein
MINPTLWIVEIKDANLFQNLILANNKYFAEKVVLLLNFLTQSLLE